ncbi:hypothetical protein [Paenibacillus kribbensis]|uniref:hypothetical protein n=1 Tax=Paenibacillus kribbensis TaxID=172713 RepID=UPI00083900F5|nr:hypothetical protein [Paenibacillus kribbensis]
MTPTYLIINRAYHNAQEKVTPSIGDVRRDILKENLLSFSIDVSFNKEEASRNFHAVLRQGKTTLQPVGGILYGLNSPATKLSPDEEQAKYMKEVIGTFEVDDRIDLKDPLYLTFIYSDKNDTATYEIIPSQQR